MDLNFRIYVLFFFFLKLNQIYAQLPANSVDYLMKYDSATCRYDIYLVIREGIAESQAERLALNAQVSVIVPTGTEFIDMFGSINQVNESYYPRRDNGLGSINEWYLTGRTNSPALDPAHDYISFTANISNPAYYRKNNTTATISAGDSIKIFSLKITGTSTQCGLDLRLFDNGKDLNSTQLGGANYSNGFTMGNLLQKYNSNLPQKGGSLPKITDLSTSCNSSIEINIEANTSVCQSPLSYEWTGPNSYQSTSQDVSISNSNASNNGVYTVIVADRIGCKDTFQISAFAKPNAGTDRIICNGTSISLSGSPDTYFDSTTGNLISGSWGEINGPANPPNSILTNEGNGKANFAFNNPPGGTNLIYKFWYKIGNCNDTINFIVKPTPIVSCSDPKRDLCVGEASDFLSPQSGGTWSSSTNSIITLSNNNIATGISAGGPVTLFYADNSTGCMNKLEGFAVNALPEVSITGPKVICVGESTQASPAVGGVWYTTNPIVATTTASGFIIGTSEGICQFVFVQGGTGCTSKQTENLIVLSRSELTLDGPSSLCVGETTKINIKGNNGMWQVSDSSVLKITPEGIVTALGEGKADIENINTENCTSNTIKIEVKICTNTANTDVQDFEIFPNPVKEYLHFNTEYKIQKINIYDALGKRISNIIHESDRVNISNLQSGFILLKPR